MPLITIDKDICAKDGFCQKVCLFSLLQHPNGDYPVPIPNIEDRCIRCGHCVAVCPTKALTHQDISYEKCPVIRDNIEMPVNAIEQFLKSRRSIRSYKDKSVSKNQIKAILEFAQFAPSGHNSQTISWSVFSNKEDVKKIADTIFEFFKSIVDSEIARQHQLDPKGICEAYESGQDNILRGAPALLVALERKDNPIATISGAIYLTTLELAAKTQGFGTCWAGLLMLVKDMGYKPLMDILKIPEDKQMIGAMVLGYPAVKYRRIPMRNQPDVIWN